MFDFLGSLGNFMGGMPSISSLGFMPPVPTPNFGDFMNLNNLFSTALGPAGLMGIGPSNTASVSGQFSGMIGGNMSGLSTGRAPVYRTVYDQVPVYQYNHYKAEDYQFQQGLTVDHDVKTAQTQTRYIDPVIINFDGNGQLGVTGRDNSSHVISDQTSAAVSVNRQGRRIDTTTTTDHRWVTHENWDNKIDFDVNGDGHTDRTEWLKSGTKDAFLVYDKGDGTVDGTTLMNTTGLHGEQNMYKDGWDKARALADKNGDGILQGDELKNLKVWNDANGDGKVDPGELQSLADKGVVSIDTNTGDVVTKQLTGYRSVPRQELSGYYELNAYVSTGGSNVGLNFIPVSTGSTVSNTLGGTSVPPVAPPVSTVTQNPLQPPQFRTVYWPYAS